MTGLFDGQLAEKARRKAKSLGRFTCPLAYWLASADEAAAERERLAQLFENVRSEHQADVRARLLNKNNAKHVACLFELEAWQFFDNREGWSAVYQPSAPFGTPDVRAVAPNGQVFYVEALTTFEDSERSTRRSLEHAFLEQLDRIEHFYLVNVTSISVEPKAKPTHFRGWVTAELDTLRANEAAIDDVVEITYKTDGAFVLLKVFRTERTEPGQVLVGHGMELGCLPPTPFKDRMGEKVEKYSDVVDMEASLLLAVGVAQSIYRGHGVVDSMYGGPRMSLQLDRQTGAPISDFEPTRDFDSGLLWNSRSGSLAPHLSGVLEVAFNTTPLGECFSREPVFGFIHNRFADSTVDPELFADLLQFALPGDDADTFIDDWRRLDAGDA